VFENTGSVFTGRKQLGHRGDDTVSGRSCHHFACGFRVHQTQSYADRESRRQGSFVRTFVRHTAMLSHHVCARAQTH